MAQVLFDTIEGSDLELGDGNITITRTGKVTGIDAAPTSDPFVMLRAMEAAISESGQAHPGVSNALLSRLIVRPGGAGDECNFSVTYRGPQFSPQSGGGIRWLVEDASTLSSEVEEIDPNGNPYQAVLKVDENGDLAPLATNPATGLAGGDSEGDPADNPGRHTADLNVLRPRRVLRVRGYIIGRPDIGVLDALGAVNAVTWNGLQPGYWLCTEVSSELEGRGTLFNNPSPQVNAQALYRVGASFLSRVRRDWSTLIVYKTPLGKIPKALVGRGAELLELQNARYVPGQLQRNGFTKACPYELKDFAALFGF